MEEDEELHFTATASPGLGLSASSIGCAQVEEDEELGSLHLTAPCGAQEPEPSGRGGGEEGGGEGGSDDGDSDGH